MLPKSRRIVKERDWQKVHKKGISVHSAEIVIKYLKKQQPISRFGFIVGTKIDKKATQRNRIKRRLRTIIESEQEKLKDGYDIILITRPGVVGKAYAQIREKVSTLFTKAKLYK